MARTTTNISLNVWDQVTDHFNHVELANNWDKVDAHDHTSGKGVQIPTAGLASNAVTTAKIADAQITTAKIADAQVTSQKFAKDGLGPGFGLFYAYKTAPSSINHSFAVPMNAARYDLSGFYNTGTSTFQPGLKGYWRLSWGVLLNAALAADVSFQSILYKPGTGYLNSSPVVFQRGTTPLATAGSTIVLANGTTDSYQVVVYFGDSAAHSVYGDTGGGTSGNSTWFCGEFIAPAT